MPAKYLLCRTYQVSTWCIVDPAEEHVAEDKVLGVVVTSWKERDREELARVGYVPDNWQELEKVER